MSSYVAKVALLLQSASTVLAQDCSNTCWGKAAGTYTVAGVPSVYCSNGYALLQAAGSSETCSTSAYGFASAVTNSSCGYLNEGSVRTLAAFGTGVLLEDLGKGSVENDNGLAVEALRTGVSWHNGATFRQVLREGNDGDWCFRGPSALGDRTCNGDRAPLATGWPQMYHSCFSSGTLCTYWMGAPFGIIHSRVAGRPIIGSRTWLKMAQCSAPPPPPATPVPTPAPTPIPTSRKRGRRAVWWSLSSVPPSGPRRPARPS